MSPQRNTEGESKELCVEAKGQLELESEMIRCFLRQRSPLPQVRGQGDSESGVKEKAPATCRRVGTGNETLSAGRGGLRLRGR